MKYFVFGILFYISSNYLFAQSTGNTLQFISNDQFYKIDAKGTILQGPISIGNVLNDCLETYTDYNGERLRIYTVDGIENFFKNKSDTVISIYSEPEFSALQLRNGKLGIISINGKIILNIEYESVEQLYEQNDGWKFWAYKVQKNGKYGIISKDGKTLLPIEYDEIKPNFTENDLIKVGINGKFGLIDKQLNTITPVFYDDLGEFSSNRCRFKKDNKYGFINNLGKEIIPNTLNHQPENFRKSFCEFYKIIDNTYYAGIIDSTGKIVVQPLYESITLNPYGFQARLNNKYGILNLNGKIVLPFIYKSEEISYDEYANTLNIKSKGKISKFLVSNGLLIPINYELSDFENGYYRTKKNKKSGLVNTQGKLVIPYLYDDITNIEKDFFIYKNNNQFGIHYFNPTKQSKVKYEELYYVKEFHLLLAKKQSKWGLLDENEQIRLPFVYDELCPISFIYQKPYNFSSTFMNYWINDLYMDTDTLYTNTGLPANSYYASKDGKKGVINVKGEEILPIQYTELSIFYNKTSLVKKEGKQYFIDANNNILHGSNKTNYDSIDKVYNNLYITHYKQKYGILSSDGKEVLPPIYDTIEVDDVFNTSIFEKNIYAIKDNKYTILNPKGKISTRNTSNKSLDFVGGFGIFKLGKEPVAIMDSIGNVIWTFKGKEIRIENIGNAGTEICLLTNLEEIQFRGNDWDGSFKLPTCFYNLTNLKKLIIHASDIDSIPNEVINLKQLHYLHVYSHDLSYISPNIAELNHLDTLIIFCNTEIPAEISKLTKLTYLETRTNKVPSNKYVKTLNVRASGLPLNLPEFTSLKKLIFYPEYEANENGFEYERKKDSTIVQSIKTICEHKEIEELCFEEESFVWSKVLIENAELIKTLSKLKKIQFSTLLDQDKAPLTEKFPNLEFVSEKW